jgi:hypothetical protein
MMGVDEYYAVLILSDLFLYDSYCYSSVEGELFTVGLWDNAHTN